MPISLYRANRPESVPAVLCCRTPVCVTLQTIPNKITHVIPHLFCYKRPEACEHQRGDEKGKLLAKWMEERTFGSARCNLVFTVNNMPLCLRRGSGQSEEVKWGEEAGVGWCYTPRVRFCSFIGETRVWSHARGSVWQWCFERKANVRKLKCCQE